MKLLRIFSALFILFFNNLQGLQGQTEFPNETTARVDTIKVGSNPAYHIRIFDFGAEQIGKKALDFYVYMGRVDVNLTFPSVIIDLGRAEGDRWVTIGNFLWDRTSIVGVGQPLTKIRIPIPKDIADELYKITKAQGRIKVAMSNANGTALLGLNDNAEARMGFNLYDPPNSPTLEANSILMNPGADIASQVFDISFVNKNRPAGTETIFSIIDALNGSIIIDSDTVDVDTLWARESLRGFEFKCVAMNYQRELDLSSEPAEASVEVEGINIDPPLPENFALHQNYPNPFNPTTTIRYDVPEQSHVSLIIYNILGQKIRTLVNESKEAQIHSVIWDGIDDNGRLVPSGIYFYRMNAGSVVKTKTMVLTK
jgi:hypothetical protein